MTKFSIFLLAVFVVVSTSVSSADETDDNESPTNSNRSSAAISPDRSLIQEILVKQDMAQALILTNNVLQVMTDVQLLKEEIHHLNKENADLKNQLSSFFNTSCIEDIQCGYPSTPVAFYAYFANDFKSMPKGSTFIFDTVETNIGNGYSKTTGTFTAPASGLYAFTWTFHVAGRYIFKDRKRSQYGEINAALMQNGVTKSVIVADTEKQYDIGSSTGFVVLKTKAGDRFRIAVTEWDGQGDIYSNNKNGRTTFSGFRVS